MKTRFNSILLTRIIMVFGFAGMIVLNSCNKDEDSESADIQIEKIAIMPEDASMAIGKQENFSAYALTTTGDTLYFNDLDVNSHWWSSDTTVFTVKENGVATGKKKGNAFCKLEATITYDSSKLKRIRFYTGRDSAFVSIF